jgi:hypothetical protein
MEWGYRENVYVQVKCEIKRRDVNYVQRALYCGMWCRCPVYLKMLILLDRTDIQIKGLNTAGAIDVCQRVSIWSYNQGVFVLV